MNVNRKFSMFINYKSNFPTSPICYNASNFYCESILMELQCVCAAHVHIYV